MNKKNLSVVMAGAMLATSVAPVLADTTATEIGLSQKALLKNTIKNKMEEKMISSNSVLATTDFVDTDLQSLMNNGKSEDEKNSAYGVRVLNKDGKAVDLSTIRYDGTGDGKIDTGDDSYKVAAASTEVIYTKAELDKLFNSEAMVKDYTIQIVERYTTEFYGEIIPGTEIVAKSNETTYKAASLKNDITTDLQVSSGKFFKEVSEPDDVTGACTVTMNSLSDINDDTSNKKIELKAGSTRLDGKLPLDKDGKLLDVKSESDVHKFDHYANKVTYVASQKVEKDPTVVSAYKLVDDITEDTNVSYLASDLYDGFALTAKGTEISADISNAKKEAEKPGDELVVLDSNRPDALVNGVESFTITYYKSLKDKNAVPSKVEKVVTVRSTNLKEIQSLYDMLDKGDFKVGIIGGNNRYETAVNVAKTREVPKATDSTTDGNSNIVLVNGTSLVDGLAAAPFATTLKWNGTAGKAPVLLSEADKLPAATKAYIEELVDGVKPSNRKYITINLVGGESVLSESLVKELKGMGFKVERFGGDNREETSIEVAEAMVKNNATGKGNAFVVGGNGEADAMSIAAKAAETKTPIIVSSVHGLTKDALKYIKTNASAGDVTIIGGESVVSKEEEKKIDEALTANAVERVSGSNRFETNAKVIEKFYKGQSATGVVLVKDGQSNANELVDALSASNYAAEQNAPVVLASSSLKDGQKNALLNVKVQSTAVVSQVGIGAERTVLETIAGLFGISNVK